MSGSVQKSLAGPPRFDLVLVAASQGAVPLYLDLFGRLDAALGAAVVLVQHRHPAVDVLAEVLRVRSAVPVAHPVEGAPLGAGALYVCPADRQLLFDASGNVTFTPLEGRARPAADPVFASAASVYGPRVLAVVLSGRLHDGSAGVRAVKAAGGRVLVQDPASAAQGSMPASALATGCADACLPPRKIADAINAFVAVPGAAELFAGRVSPWAPLVVS